MAGEEGFALAVLLVTVIFRIIQSQRRRPFLAKLRLLSRAEESDRTHVIQAATAKEQITATTSKAQKKNGVDKVCLLYASGWFVRMENHYQQLRLRRFQEYLIFEAEILKIFENIQHQPNN